ncbi:MAG: Hsp20/alpha crystallin family protein [Cyclobacteriaceae bacterium]|nr:Hsp20/alpha crystallin family protein [Cyclobacteriaceae bacterium]
MARIERGNHFLSGFANENFIEEFYMDRGKGLSPGTFFSEDEDRYKLEIGIPNFGKEDISLQLVGNELLIKGKKPGARLRKNNISACFLFRLTFGTMK